MPIDTGFVNMFLSWNIFIPLARLTYMMYLVHVFVEIWAVVFRVRPIFVQDTTMVIIVSLSHSFSVANVFILSTSDYRPT